MKHLGIAEVIKFHLVFDDFLLKGSYYDVFEAIRAEILDDYKNLMARFYFDEDSDEAIKMALIKLARSDRKKFSVNKILPRSMTNRVYAKLFSKDFLVLEKSQEKPRVKNKRQILKKSERAYKIEDKIHFNSHFSRFWFRFIEPNLSLLKEGRSDEILELIKREFDEYASLGFELLSGELMAKKLGFDGILLSSFWSKNIELDMLFSINGKIIVGEAKYKERKICKNVLNLVLHKCERLGIKPDIVALFSKSGFSNELLGLKDERLRLYEIKDYEELL
jgi:ATPase